ncbi:ATP-binding protein [Rubellimicrobium roseum]|uniref:ATP-binding protein n=1 Tax=Rubellimicrobium roseum TaxID=687525 RepID=A0A5C4NBA5_9RHOB|nr:ATP-binding protein [Rubellimicrobium roseum]TNC71983.1 ATP-binding protein [Rubellimicrobium roseum]
MIYANAEEWLRATKRHVLLFGMSGLGKTHVAKCLRGAGGWFHYSVDYRIGTRYMGELIADNAKREAMKVPFLRELLLSDSIYIGSNITFDNLDPVSTYLGKPGDPARGGLPFAEYQRRQAEFREAEVAALLDTGRFIDRAEALYGYPHFICDTGGSICEWVDPEDPRDPVLTALASRCLMVWIEGSEAHTAELVRRFDKAPKPMCYRPDFLLAQWQAYLDLKGVAEDQVDPDDFIRFTYAAALAHRQPLYAAMARNWGITVRAEDMARVNDEAAFVEVVAGAMRERMRGAA